MLALRDENAVNAAQTIRQAQGKGHLAPKTPGARYPKTPSGHHDENAVGGKTILGKTKGTINQPARQRLVTPSGTQARAPLGNKTTNAKAKNGQVQGVKSIVKELEKTDAKQNTIQKPKNKGPVVDPLKVAVHIDLGGDEHEIEHAPLRVKDLPYESDVFPEGGLNFDGLKKENMFKGYYNHFYNPLGEDGLRFEDRKHEERMQKALKKNDEEIIHDIDSMDWSVSDVPETRKLVQKKTAPVANLTKMNIKPSVKYPATINSRRAASALSMTDGSTVRAKKLPDVPVRRPISSLLPGKRVAKAPTAPSKSVAAESAVGEAASRSTLGYTKGRSASSLISGRAPMPGTVTETARTNPPTSASALTVRRDPAPQKRQTTEEEQQSLQRLQFLSIFEPEDDIDVVGSAPQFDNDEDEEFELKLE
ncbi:conserved hypothetical protein [Verticillium alfalfae VaMs.102]|uniref:Uncharacterized protein n=1 Tax=Verticillium alfalfae (strain VaMs.102 / ATCC MYA-4576 / FGSC 10136) TaxID=526221 RepID=C9SG74_VERA1|nr:conserved hypothetical protein [Verticillium alfalfae VaMs.102]EEY18088.1 conserved hypothetical protein [Verticillium alfalfae VaMs.102]